VTPRRTALCAALAFCVLGLSAYARPAAAQFADIQGEPTAAAPADDAGGDATVAPLSPDELRELVAPVALYPDDLLALVLPATTQPLQIVEAQRFLDKQKANKDLKPNENWDPAVLALLNYPEVIKLMNDDLDWTQRLGNAVMDQQEDVLAAIQDARQGATAAGYLQSNDKQTVVTEKETIIIKSADPEVIYVPTYDPAPVVQNTYVNYPPPVYSTPYPYYYAPGAAFVTGMFVGAAFSYAFDWNNNDIDIDCCGDRNNNINIDNTRNTNVNRDNIQNKFNGDRNPKAKGGDGMKWSPQKARTKSSATRPATANKARPNSAGIAKQLGTGGTGVRKHTPPTTRPSAQTRQQSNRGNQSLGANKQQRQQQMRQPQKPRPSQMQQRQKQQKFNSMQSRPKSGSFSSMPSQQRARQQSNRGTSSIGGVRAPNRSRSGGRR
jgi:hypothetical protein